MLFSSKKAMSPLIATVLLIAFAVALGAMIMNWGTGGVVEAPVDIGSVCSGVSLELSSDACYANSKLTFNVKNDGKEKIDGVRIIQTSEFGVSSSEPSDSSMIVGESISKTIIFGYGGGSVSIDFVPLVLFEDEIVECSGVTQNVLPSC